MNKILLILTIIFFSSCTQKDKPTFTLQGQIENPENNFILLYQENDIERKLSTLIDTIYLDENGNFKAEYFQDPHYYTLVINENKRIPLAIDDNQQITIHVNDSITVITGSKDTDLLLEYEEVRKESLNRLVVAVRNEISEENEKDHPDPIKIDSLGKLELLNYELHLEEINGFIKNKMGNSIALYPTSLRWKDNYISLFDSLVSTFETTHHQLPIAHQLREKTTRLQQTAVGGKVPEIAMNTANGDTVSLFAINKKYTLIDFWASWCAPCRRESAALNTTYEKYKNKGFSIYGISLDTDKNQWINALEKDNRVWPNVSSLEGFQTPAAYNYTITALPMNYLIDEKGTIIDKNLHGEELISQIDSVMKSEL
ncbi:MAG TPA: TlpA disulfide reductase family protein [Chitinophagales bacterium]|nr:TlpA disulfide reductase family protein [Chitinophagales bacterium]